MKRDKLQGVSDKTPFIRGRDDDKGRNGTNGGTKMTLLAMRRNTVIMCKCNQTPVVMEKGKVPCIIIMCKCEEEGKESTTKTSSSSDT